jgi:RNA-directed DNA polymerase
VMHDRGKSDDLVVPANPANKAQGGAAESGEGRGSPKGNAAGETRPGLRAGRGVSSELGRVRQVAREDKEVRFTALLHHVDVDRLRAAYWALRPKAAPGVDGVTWHEYGRDLEENLRDLHARVHRGSYRAKPSRRTYIPKPDGRQRPLGIAALEDKLLQRALVEVLNAIYEQDFVGFSYGFRPGRSPHQALDALATGIVRKRVNWVLDLDFRDYFSRLDHRWLERFVEHRIADRRVLRLIQKWLAAGVIEDGSWTAYEEGVPQGLRFPRCSPMSTRTTCSTCGLTNGDGGARTVTWSSCVSPTMRWWGSNIGMTPNGSELSYATGLRSSAWRSMPRRRG